MLSIEWFAFFTLVGRDVLSSQFQSIPSSTADWPDPHWATVHRVSFCDHSQPVATMIALTPLV
ncbi:hypothetical protein An07g08540 [Aspergillus niger]|uniref:Uncharacterized protein n=2 Tax=Aspergillus niger TaxID=5061 RepID=A2QP83_ASPNC|nr:hypothetical protein An07g08540 [Aspergillus niger]CAK39648.1 hypothetical protein An07g08540 [Aspergillus niger]